MKKRLIRIMAILLSLAIIAAAAYYFIASGYINLVNPGMPEDGFISEDPDKADLSSDVFTSVFENDKAIFYVNEFTTDIKLLVKETGMEWTSERKIQDEIERRGYIFEMDYVDNNGAALKMNSMDDSVVKGQYEITMPNDTQNGELKIRYTCGNIDAIIMTPPAISVERMDMFCEKLDKADALRLKTEFYNYIDLTDPIYAKNLQQNKSRYPKAVSTPWYYLNPTIQNVETTIKEIAALFKSAGYTMSDLKLDAAGIQDYDIPLLVFDIALYYKLNTDGSISLRIPEKEIYHHKEYPLEKIRVLTDFAQFDQETEGYFLMPDGSGSIVNFGNNKHDIRSEPYYVSIYGLDKGRDILQKQAYYNQAIFPVFGAYTVKDTEENGVNKRVKNSMFAIIEEGETFAGVECVSSDRKTQEQNRIWAEFRINETQRIHSINMYGGSVETEFFSKHQSQRYLGDLKIRYNFLTNENADYNGMARLYQKYLFGDDRAASGTKDYMVNAEIPCTINVRKNFLGFNYNSDFAITKFKQAEEISKSLKNEIGVKNLNIKLTGWFGDGVQHGYANNLNISSVSGGLDDFKSLIENTKNNGINLYPDVDIQYIYTSAASIKGSDSAMLLSNSKSITGSYSYNSFIMTTDFLKATLNENGFKKNLNGFLDKYSDYNNKNVSFRSIGEDIVANYDEKNYKERQNTLKYLLDEIKKVNENYNIMGNVGNAPFAPCLSVINNMPITWAGHDKADYSIPFTSLVYSGFVEYSYEPINLSGSEKEDLLRLIEAGAGANYILTGTVYEKLTDTPFAIYYSTNYNDVKKIVFDTFNYLNEAQKETYGSQIKRHDRIAPGIFKTEYENEKCIIVNYTDNDYTNGDVKVQAKNYWKGSTYQ